MASDHWHGLNDHQIALIRHVLAPYHAKIEQVGLFGSRATGTYRPDSDIDLVIYGDVQQADIDRLWTLFDSSLLPFKVDLIGYNLIPYPPLKAHIDAVMRPLFAGNI